MTTVSQRLQRKVQQEFGSEAGTVLEVLVGVPESLPLGDLQAAERLQAAIVLPSEGDLEKFWDLVELAHIDWRDLLVAADLADEDWPTRLDLELGT